jgi:hypothetical protein
MEALTSMGFDESSARMALARCNGDVERALDLLLGGFTSSVSNRWSMFLRFGQ